MRFGNRFKRSNRKNEAKDSNADENSGEEDSFETVNSADSIITKTIPQSKKIKKISKKSNYLKQKKSKLKETLGTKQANELTRKRESKQRALNLIKRSQVSEENIESSENSSQQATECIHKKDFLNRSLLSSENKPRSSRRSLNNSDTNLALKVISNKTSVKSPKKSVLVPNWRVISFKPTYKLEGTENLNDDFYLKKHQKYENEEKMIKRRDLRRQREEYMKFKMLNKTKSSISNKNNKIKSPSKSSIEEDSNKEITIKNDQDIDLEDIEYIQIIDDREIKLENEIADTKTETVQEAEIENKNELKGGDDEKKHKNNKKQRSKQNLENSKSNGKKINRCKSYPSLPLNPVNDNLNNISINTKPVAKSNKKVNMSVYDDLDSDYVDTENINKSNLSKNSRQNKRKSNNFLSTSLRLPAKKRTRLSSNLE